MINWNEIMEIDGNECIRHFVCVSLLLSKKWVTISIDDIMTILQRVRYTLYRARFTEQGLQSKVYRARFTEQGLQSKVYRARFTEQGLQSKVYRARFTEQGLQSKVYRARFTEQGLQGGVQGEFWGILGNFFLGNSRKPGGLSQNSPKFPKIPQKNSNFSGNYIYCFRSFYIHIPITHYIYNIHTCLIRKDNYIYARW